MELSLLGECVLSVLQLQWVPCWSVAVGIISIWSKRIDVRSGCSSVCVLLTWF